VHVPFTVAVNAFVEHVTRLTDAGSTLTDTGGDSAHPASIVGSGVGVVLLGAGPGGVEVSLDVQPASWPIAGAAKKSAIEIRRSKRGRCIMLGFPSVPPLRHARAPSVASISATGW
jgi:hypothetical protein